MMATLCFRFVSSWTVVMATLKPKSQIPRTRDLVVTSAHWVRRSTLTAMAALDRLTIAAIAVIAYCLANVVHEAVGHGIACVLAGGHALRLDSMSLRCTEENL